MLDIIYQDEQLIAVNKPAGLLVHPSWISPASTPNLVSLLKRHTGLEKVHTVHRLDRATSGVILFATDLAASQHLQQQFVDRQVRKRYLCVVRGWTGEGELIDYPLIPKRDKYAEPFAAENPEPKEAQTEYRRLNTVELDIPVGRYPVARYSLVEALPKTGRKHQIRRHMKHILHPIVGDTKHGEGRHNRLFREHFDIHRLLLMATDLTFTHPVTGRPIQLHADLDPQVEQLFNRFGWQGSY